MADSSSRRRRPADRCTSHLGREYGREHDGTYLQNWNPLMLAADLLPGKIVGQGLSRHARHRLSGSGRQAGRAERLLPACGRRSCAG